MSAGFDFDLTRGEIFERYIEETMRGKVEAKAEFLGESTGNHFLEYARKDKPSGIAITESKFWAIALPTSFGFLVHKTETVKDIGRCFYVDDETSRKMGGDDGYTSAVVIPLWVLFDPESIKHYSSRGKSFRGLGLCPF